MIHGTCKRQQEIHLLSNSCVVHSHFVIGCFCLRKQYLCIS